METIILNSILEKIAFSVGEFNTEIELLRLNKILELAQELAIKPVQVQRIWQAIDVTAKNNLLS